MSVIYWLYQAAKEKQEQSGPHFGDSKQKWKTNEINNQHEEREKEIMSIADSYDYASLDTSPPKSPTIRKNNWHKRNSCIYKWQELYTHSTNQAIWHQISLLGANGVHGANEGLVIVSQTSNHWLA